MDKITFEEFKRLYDERYGIHGPSISSSCEGKNNSAECGCWVCQTLELRKWKKSQS